MITSLIEQFGIEPLIDFFRNKTVTFRSITENILLDNTDFTDGVQVGVFTTNDTNKHELSVYVFKVQKPLSERSGKKAQ